MQSTPAVIMPHPDDSEDLSNYDRLSPKKKVFIEAMIKTFGNIGQSCQLCGIRSRRTYYNWLKDDPYFAAVIADGEFEESMLDFAESKLMKLVDKQDVAATIFLLKTKGKKRGYVERTEISAKLDLNKAPSWFDSKELPDTSAFEEAEIISSTPTQNPTQNDIV